MATTKILFPRGKYRVAQPNTLFANILGGSFYIVGEGGGFYGGGVTEIHFDAPGATITDYLFSNAGRTPFTTFEQICFKGIGADKQFMHFNQGGSGGNQSLIFNKCIFTGFSTIINSTGSVLGSEVTFNDCKINYFDKQAFILNNEQSVNWRFINTDIEIFTGTVFEFLQGSTVLVVGGSIYAKETSIIVSVPTAADFTKFGPGNGNSLTFLGSRFEMSLGAVMAKKLNYLAHIDLQFHSCGMGGMRIPDPAVNRMFTWNGTGALTMRDCRALTSYRLDYRVNANSFGQEMAITIDNCVDIDQAFLTSATFTVNDGGSNNPIYPLFQVTNCGRQLDGIYYPNDTQTFAHATSPNTNMNRMISQQRRAIAFTPISGGNVHFCTTGTVVNTVIPPVRITEIEFYPEEKTGYGGSTATITITNAAGTRTLATFTWEIGAPASPKLTATTNYFVAAMSGDYLVYTFTTNTGVSTPFRGCLFLTY